MFESPASSIFGTLSGCMGCMVGVESLAKEMPSSMNLMTFSSFLFISLEGLIFTSKFLTVERKIPFRGYMPVVFTFFTCNVINNQALNFHVPVPLHIIFRSGSILTSLIMNRILLKRTYPLTKYLSVFAITIGIILCSLATANLEKNPENVTENAASSQRIWELVIGIMMLILALLISSYMSICQENMYAVYGKHPREAMFYIHAISLPFFAFIGHDIYKSALEVTNFPPLQIGDWTPFGDVSFIWIKLFAISFLQFICIFFVYNITSQLDSLSATLVVTLRKFLSLLVSLFWFKNTFTTTHWLGTALVFFGTLAFSYGPKKSLIDDTKKTK